MRTHTKSDEASTTRLSLNAPASSSWQCPHHEVVKYAIIGFSWSMAAPSASE